MYVKLLYLRYVYKLYNLSVGIVSSENLYYATRGARRLGADHPNRHCTDGDDAAALGGDDRLAKPCRCDETTVAYMQLLRQ